MIVKAIRMGFYKGRKREGVIFRLEDKKHFSENWMEKIDETKPASPEVSIRSNAGPYSARGKSSGNEDVI